MPEFKADGLAVVTIKGRLTKDAEGKYLPSGTFVTNFDVAVNLYGQDTPDYYRVQWFGGRGEKLAQYLTKGKQVLVIGSLKHRQYTNANGEPRVSVEVTVDQFSFLGGKREDGEDQAGDFASVPETDEIPF